MKKHNDKSQLIEKLGVFFEQKDKIAPVAARILGYLILNGKKGTTFNELVKKLCASKSTISTHLTHLQGTNRVTYFTKVGDRKKYFLLNPDSIIYNIDQMITDWTTQKELHTEVKEFKIEFNNQNKTTEEEKFDLDFHTNYIDFLEKTIKSVNTLREQITTKIIRS